MTPQTARLLRDLGRHFWGLAVTIMLGALLQPDAQVGYLGLWAAFAFGATARVLCRAGENP